MSVVDNSLAYQAFKDSYLVVYHGPIRGGKTVSMTADLSVDIVNGRRVFTNYPIDFWYDGVHYQSEELDADELVYIDDDRIKKKYTDSVIGWDEGALSLPAREHASAQNKLQSQAMLLRGKLEMSLYFTVQYLSMWEKNMRLQEDALIFCHDLSFRFKNLQRGTTISQSFQDISGRFTGETFEYSQRVYRQTFHAKPFWNTYDTKKTFSVVRDKLGYNDVRKNLKNLDFEKEDAESDSYYDTEVLVRHLIDELASMEQYRVPQSVLMEMARDRGFAGKASELGSILFRNGANINARNMWTIPALVSV